MGGIRRGYWRDRRGAHISRDISYMGFEAAIRPVEAALIDLNADTSTPRANRDAVRRITRYGCDPLIMYIGNPEVASGTYGRRAIVVGERGASLGIFPTPRPPWSSTGTGSGGCDRMGRVSTVGEMRHYENQAVSK